MFLQVFKEFSLCMLIVCIVYFVVFSDNFIIFYFSGLFRISSIYDDCNE